MNTEKFFEAFTDLDDDLIENALPQAQSPEIVRPAERIRLWKPIAAAAAVVAVVCGIAVGMKIYSTNRHIIAPVDSTSDDRSLPSSNTANSAVNYSYIQIDEPGFSSAQELVSKSDIIVSGKVTNISFELHDRHTGELVTEYTEDADLCTVYDVDIISSYKSNVNGNLRIIMYNGLKDYKVDEQAELLGRTAEPVIPVLENPDNITLGEEYLFLLSHSSSQSSTGVTMTSLLNHSQGVFPTDQPTVKERYSQASLKDITECLIEVNVLHNNQNLSLSFKDTVKLFAEVEDAIIYNNAPIIDKNMTINEQVIKEYSKNGYAITVRHKFTDKPLYEGEFNKTSRIISDVTVLIGAGDEPSYLTYSYIIFSTDGTPEKHSSNAIVLGVGTTENILQILENKDGGNSDEVSVIHNEQSMTLSEQQSTALMDAVMQAILTDCLPGLELTTVITEQDIKEYGKNGYAVTLQYNDIDEPLFEGAYNKKSRVVCNVTVLIGEDNEPSRIFYSYTLFSLDGASEQRSGGTFALSSSSRDSILQILNP